MPDSEVDHGAGLSLSSDILLLLAQQLCIEKAPQAAAHRAHSDDFDVLLRLDTAKPVPHTGLA